MADKYVKLNDVMEAIGGVPKKKDSPYPTPIHLAAKRVITKLKERIAKVPTADVVEVKHGENIGTVHPVDEFVCSECGIVLEGWTRVVTDEDDGELLYYEYEFKYCPDCGAKMDGGKKE